MKKYLFLPILVSGLYACLSVSSVSAKDKVSVAVQDDGSVKMENSLLSLRWSTRTDGGINHPSGIVDLRFKPIDAEMVHVLYGQTDYLTGRLFGEVWDPVEYKGFQEGRVKTGEIYTPEAYGVAADGSAAFVKQVSEGDYRMERTAILRRDLGSVEVNYRLTNISAEPSGFSLRLHNVMSPSSRGIRENRSEWVQLPTEEGVLALDQSLSLPKYTEKYKGQKYFLPVWESEPKRWWVSGKQPNPDLKGLWAAELGGKAGDGLVFVFEKDALVGYYNSPGSTIEPVLKAQALRPGESWEFRAYVGAFSGVGEGVLLQDANPLMVITKPLSKEKGQLKGSLVPLFIGTLKVVGKDGKVLFETKAEAAKAVDLKVKMSGEDYRLEAFDSTGKRIGQVNADGTFALEKTEIVSEVVALPEVKEEVYTNHADAIAAFLEPRDFVIYCDGNASEAEKAGARDIAQKLGVGITWTQPTQKAIYIGTPSDSETIRDIGKFKNSLSETWPGSKKGAILYHENIELTKAPGLLLSGSDVEGVKKAIAQFENVYLKNVVAPTGFAFRVAGIEEPIFPFSPIGLKPVGDQVVRVKAARGEYESAQVVLKAYDALRNIHVHIAPLIHEESGKQIGGKYLTNYRKDRGPVWLRWVEYYPLDLPNGESGFPDPLIEKPLVDIPAGTTRAAWLTFVIPQDAPAGLYRSSMTIEANGEKKELPIELTVWDFEIPKEGVKGEPYMSYQAFPPDDKRWLTPEQVRDLTQNMVEHGMRVLHIGENNEELFRWHFDPEGKIQPNEWLVVSEDGKVALDTRGFDERIAMIDQAAKPFEVEYLIMYNSLLRWPHGIGKFRQTFPDRYKDLPEREGHPYSSYYAREMLSLFKKHLERKGWLDRMTMKISDEPPGFAHWWDSWTLAAREAGFPFMTCLNNVEWKEAEEAFGSSMRVVQPLYQLYDKDYFDKARKEGIQISWYNCGPPPKNSVQTPASHLRSYIWQAAKADLDIIAWWGIQNWNHHSHHEIWFDRHSHWNSLMYPAHPKIAPWRQDGKGRLRDASPIDSRRWEQIREGLEDTAYVKLLRERIAAARERGETEKADKGQAVLDGIWNEVFPTLNDYQPPFSKIQESREKVAHAILELAPPTDKK